ncbi:hypothetical protein P7K49_020669 [Saguinus oedipus]|uniref:Uncharacterized protein n=1 Tax=Saguinus oedipus TaxID=9490 RepID=A0ABQ9V192_SAGOE|nr:hypothetical protein P7K49_020669 [Saguinus oedipus]
MKLRVRHQRQTQRTPRQPARTPPPGTGGLPVAYHSSKPRAQGARQEANPHFAEWPSHFYPELSESKGELHLEGAAGGTAHCLQEPGPTQDG